MSGLRARPRGRQGSLPFSPCFCFCFRGVGVGAEFLCRCFVVVFSVWMWVYLRLGVLCDRREEHLFGMSHINACVFDLMKDYVNSTICM